MRAWKYPSKTAFFAEFVIPHGHCSLCGNSGIVDTRGVETAAGVPVGGRFFCLCPNGRAMKGAFAGVMPPPDGMASRIEASERQRRERAAAILGGTGT